MLDDIDCRLLELLQNNSNISTKELAREVNLSQTPVYERVRRLEREGYIKQYVALLNAEKLNLGFSVYCHVRLQHSPHHPSRTYHLRGHSPR